MNIREQIKQTPTSQLIKYWSGDEIPQWSETTSLHWIGIELSRRGSKSVSFLKEQARSYDKRIKSCALSSLGNPWCYDSEVENLLIQTFFNEARYEPEDAAAFKNIVLGRFIKIEHYPLNRSEVEPLLDSEDQFLSASAMVYLSYKFPEEAITILRDGLKSNNPMKKGMACAEAGERKIFELRNDVESLQNDTEMYVANNAQTACFLF